MKVKTLIQSITIAAILIIVFNSCAKEQAITADNFDNAANVEQIRQEVETTLAEIQSLQESPSLEQRSHCDGRIVIVRANSHNALKEAIHRAGEGGIVYLKSGVHTESSTVNINCTVTIFGEKGAILKLNAPLLLSDPASGAFLVKPAIHVKNAPNTNFINIEIKSSTEGGIAILLENASNSNIIGNRMEGFQSAVLVEKSDRVCIVRNNIKATTAWQRGVVDVVPSVVLVNGKNAYVAHNEVSNSIFGIWACGLDGICERNFTHSNVIGIILCKVPTGFLLPSGDLTGSIYAATNWKTRNNNSTDNQYGYVIIDGANNNLLENNNAARNAVYDMELTTDTYRFGFLTPKSFKNKVIAGRYQHIRIKDCGENNTVIGGVKVDTGSDPCN